MHILAFLAEQKNVTISDPRGRERWPVQMVGSGVVVMHVDLPCPHPGLLRLPPLIWFLKVPFSMQCITK